MKKTYKLIIGMGTIVIGIITIFLATSIVSALISLVSIPSGTSLILYALTSLT